MSAVWLKTKSEMNEVRKLYNDDGCVLQGSPNDYESWSSARALGPMERKEEYKKNVL